MSAKVSDALLLRAARDGDVAAFEALIRPHVPTVRRLARSFVRDEAEADDLAQDALIRAFRGISQFEGRSAFSTWLYVIVRSSLLDSKRGRKRPERYGDDVADQLVEGSPSPEDVASDKQKHAILWKAIGELDETFRLPLVLFAVEGLSYDEIASIEDVPVGTVRSRIARARARLAELLAARTADSAPSGPSPGTGTPGSSSNPRHGTSR